MKLKKENCTKFQGVVVNLIDFDLQNNISRSGYGKNFFFNVSKTRSNFYNFLKKNIFTFPLRDVHTIIFKKKKKKKRTHDSQSSFRKFDNSQRACVIFRDSRDRNINNNRRSIKLRSYTYLKKKKSIMTS